MNPVSDAVKTSLRQPARAPLLTIRPAISMAAALRDE